MMTYNHPYYARLVEGAGYRKAHDLFAFWGPVEMVHDLPGESGRLVADAIGVEKVWVNGHLSVDGNEPTGVLAGSVLRSGRDTDTVGVDAP